MTLVFILGAILIGQITSIITTSSLKNQRLIEKLRSAGNFIEERGIPNSLAQRIISTINSMGMHGEDFDVVLEDCGPSLSAEVKIYLYQDVIARVPIFDTLSYESIKELAPQLRSVPISKGEFLVQEGDLGECMYFISRGRAEVLRKRTPLELGGVAMMALVGDEERQQERLAILEEGDFFG